jgi:cholesterol oxidase
MPRLSLPIEALKRHYDVVVVGSGYGGSIAASRLARAGRTVCVLERGREFQPGEYPDTMREAWGQMQVDGPGGRFGSHTGLYDFRRNDDIDVFLGCGLGGTSLVNANVALQADPRVFQQPTWPREFRDNPNALDEGYGRARDMLRPVPLPESAPPLLKLQALERSAKYLEKELPNKFYRPPINVHFGDRGPNHVGVYQQACAHCGDCCSGCNYAAKNTTIMNYLPDARNHGAEIFTTAHVDHLERRDGRWLVHFQFLDSGQEKFDAPQLFVAANDVVLAGGALGSTEILLRSRDKYQLPMSTKVGEHFTGNGDVLAFAYNTDSRIDGIGYGAHPVGAKNPVGPTITGIIDTRDTADFTKGIVIEEGAIPGALSGFLPEILALLAALIGHDTDTGWLDKIHEKAREWGGLFRGRYSDALSDTQTYLVMSHDRAGGCMKLVDDRLRVIWPGVGRESRFEEINKVLEKATVPLGGEFLENPLWTKLFQKDLVTVHPLGGCVMADSADSGVVNHKGQVFSGPAGADVYENLHVWDGSIIPDSLGVNPLLTISAVAERAVKLLADGRGWSLGYDFPPVRPTQDQKLPVGVQFTETMRGYYSKSEKDDFARAEQLGIDLEKERARTGTVPTEGGSFEFTLTIAVEDVEKAVTDDTYSSLMAGTVRSLSLSPDPLTVVDGDFKLFVDVGGDEKHKRMEYRMNLAATDESVYHFFGYKDMHDERGFDVWRDTTTLFITLWAGLDDSGSKIGAGILRIRPKDFAKQLSTMKATNAKGIVEGLEATARFGRYFAGSLQEVYGTLPM